tara:strand:- start:3113 stop:4408 length:1296 start_codon:yes stop_codon:yes gene_type:complete
MNNNILICLLFILIAYTIFKILSNTCNGFSIGGVGGDEDQCQEYINNIVSKCCYQGNINNCPQGFPNYCDTICSQNIDIFRDNCSNTGVDGDDITDKVYNNIIDKSCKKTCSNKEIYDYEKQSCIEDPRIYLQPFNGKVPELLDRLKNTYNDPTSNGVFISLIWNEDSNEKKVYLDGSGSIIRKDIYNSLVNNQDDKCSFGFIWDINWLEPEKGEPLVDCLFPVDGFTTPFCPCQGDSEEYTCTDESDKLNSCELTKTSKPNRCSTGLQYFVRRQSRQSYYHKKRRDPDPTDCTKNIRYVVDKKPQTVKLNKDENCFKYIVDVYKHFTPTSKIYNEGVILKDITEDGVEINEGLKQLKQLNKPTPVALVYYEYSSCLLSNKIQLKALKLNFTPDTVVIKISNYDYIKNNLVETINFVGHTTLDQIPGYNDV